MFPTVNENQADFVLSFAKTDGLDSLVRKMEVDKDKDMLVIDLQPDLITAFANKFPEADLKELDNVVEWIVLKSFAKGKGK